MFFKSRLTGSRVWPRQSALVSGFQAVRRLLAPRPHLEEMQSGDLLMRVSISHEFLRLHGEVGLGLGWGALPLDPQRRIEPGLSLVDLRWLDQAGRIPFVRGCEF